MAITAATKNVNRIVRDGPGKSMFEAGQYAVDSSSTWVQGDLLKFDSSAHALRVVSATGDSAAFVGIADNAVTGGKLVGPYAGLTDVNAAQATPGFAGPKYGVVANMILKTSDTFDIGDPVYLCEGGTSQTVTSTQPGSEDPIGIFVGPAAVASAAAGQNGQIRIGCHYGTDSLIF